MPVDIQVADADPIGLDDLAGWLDGPGFDPAEEASLIEAGPMLARLGADRGFLARLAVDELKTRCRDTGSGHRYGAQVMMLHRPAAGGYFIRANIWPAATDPVVRTSGTAPFFYGVAHDHNFSFLTHGYVGPGYWSDYWEHDFHACDGVPGEAVELLPAGRSRLWQGRTMLYRAHRDVHCQHPADSLSVSLNIMQASPATAWLDQYRFDTEAGTIAGLLSANASMTLLSVATALDTGNARDLAEGFARTHPSSRMRAAAWAALADTQRDEGGRHALLVAGSGDADPLVARQCRRWLEADDPIRISPP